MKQLVKPVQKEVSTVLAYDNEGCNGNCGCGGSGSGNDWVGAAATIIAACIGLICT